MLMTYKRKGLIWVLLFCLCRGSHLSGQQTTKQAPGFQVIVLAENGGHHIDYSRAAKTWLNKLAADSNFSISHIDNTNTICDSLLDNCQLFIQLDYPPYGWTDKAAAAFQLYIEKGKGGWLGFHHASLLGAFDGYPLWQWFSGFMGGILYQDYIAGFVRATVYVEDKAHPCMKNMPDSFIIEKDEFYTYDRSPRPNVHVIATVDESSYTPASVKKMGDHPVVWSNENVKARNLYIFMGHSPGLFSNRAYTTLFRNALFWTAGR